MKNFKDFKELLRL